MHFEFLFSEILKSSLVEEETFKACYGLITMPIYQG